VGGGDPKGIEVKEIKGPKTLMAALRHGDHLLEELNYLAVKISGIGDYGEEMFLAALETGRFDGDITKIIDLTENLNHYDLYPTYSEEQYGDFLLDFGKDETASAVTRLEQSEDPDDRALAAYILRLERYIDTKAYGRSRDVSEAPPKWMVFFRARDADAMTAAFKEFTHKTLKRGVEKPSVREAMAKFKEIIKHAVIDRTRHKERSGPEL